MNSLLKKIAAYRLQRGFRNLSNDLSALGNGLTAEQIVEFLFSKKGSLVRPWQFRSEITNLLTLYKGLNANFALEIGTANGGTLLGHCRLANPGATIISIDLPEGKFGGGYPDWKIPIYQRFAGKQQRLELIRDNSHAKDTIQKVEKILNGNKLDYLFIDGDHTYEGVKKDFELYSPFVKKDGVIVFHDVVPHPGSLCKVDEFWNEIKQKFEYKEFIDKPDQASFGVGLLYFNL